MIAAARSALSARALCTLTLLVLPVSTMAVPALASAAASAVPLSPAETRGREIFMRGTSASGREVTAVVGENPSPAPLACATCHGRDGRGRAEGGLRPANLAWETLTRASEVRPAYDAARIVRAITMGIDAGGRRLDPAMPRYRLWREDADDLVAWLRRLGSIRDPGIDDTTLHLRIAGPMRSVFQAWADRVNARGGIYARTITLMGDDDANDPATPAFAILGDPDAALTRAAIDAEVPVLRAGTIDAPEGRWIFELGASVADEVTRLLDIAAAEGAMPVAIPSNAKANADANATTGVNANAGATASINANGNTNANASARAFAELCRAPRCTRTDDLNAARAVLVLNPREMPTAANAHQLALIPSAIASEALARATGDAYVAARILPGDVDRDAAARYTLSSDRLVDQWSALAIAALTERALTRAGRGLTRESFVAALAAEYEAPTGFSPPITFGPTRRHGIATVRILHFDHATRQLTPR